MWRNVASNAITLLIVAVIALGVLIAWGQRQFTGPGPLEQAIFFEVQRGDSLQAVSRRLEEAGAITSGPIFRIGADYADMAGDLKFGNYEIPAGTSMEAILEILTEGGASRFRYVANYLIGVGDIEMRLVERTPGSGETEELAAFAPGEPVPEAYAAVEGSGAAVAYRITVAPGTTSWQVTDALRQADFLSGAVPDVPPEGRLAPETYEVRRGADRAEILARMRAAQDRILEEVWALRQADLPVDTPEEALILASIIEKETGVPYERRQVASVFVNRMEAGMRLQTDPTVIYGITGGEGVLGRGLRQSELRGATPYNTYVIYGLPPTPIANPGRASIEAAVNPAQTDYFYFVADGSGGHAFAETLAEHNRNVARWRQIEAERRNGE
ncbi:endolytic transglycosylase MltG [Rhodovulum sp. YNF3179]|uniref:endolytic transglycosylase MltG n=1 Tax=Rhodovulum sp. YNF3179 TaxID=3425127 RepID=UPI003D34C8C9